MTGRELIHALLLLSDEQLDLPVEMCIVNGRDVGPAEVNSVTACAYQITLEE